MISREALEHTGRRGLGDSRPRRSPYPRTDASWRPLVDLGAARHVGANSWRAVNSVLPGAASRPPPSDSCALGLWVASCGLRRWIALSTWRHETPAVVQSTPSRFSTWCLVVSTISGASPRASGAGFCRTASTGLSHRGHASCPRPGPGPGVRHRPWPRDSSRALAPYPPATSTASDANRGGRVGEHCRRSAAWQI